MCCTCVPVYLLTNLFTAVEEMRAGVLTTTTPLDHKAGWNDPRDVGEIAAARLLSRFLSGQGVQSVGGPADLSYTEVAQIVSEAVGRKIEAMRITDEEYRQGLLGAGLPEPVAAALVGLSRSIAGIAEFELGRNYLSTTPTTLGASGVTRICGRSWGEALSKANCDTKSAGLACNRLAQRNQNCADVPREEKEKVWPSSCLE